MPPDANRLAEEATLVDCSVTSSISSTLAALLPAAPSFFGAGSTRLAEGAMVSVEARRLCVGVAAARKRSFCVVPRPGHRLGQCEKQEASEVGYAPRDPKKLLTDSYDLVRGRVHLAQKLLLVLDNKIADSVMIGSMESAVSML